MKTLLRLIHKIALIGIVVTLIGCDLEGENTPGVYYTDFVIGCGRFFAFSTISPALDA